jgi:hypothetical protein
MRCMEHCVTVGRLQLLGAGSARGCVGTGFSLLPAPQPTSPPRRPPAAAAFMDTVPGAGDRFPAPATWPEGLVVESPPLYAGDHWECTFRQAGVYAFESATYDIAGRVYVEDGPVPVAPGPPAVAPLPAADLACSSSPVQPVRSVASAAAAAAALVVGASGRRGPRAGVDAPLAQALATAVAVLPHDISGSSSTTSGSIGTKRTSDAGSGCADADGSTNGGRELRTPTPLSPAPAPAAPTLPPRVPRTPTTAASVPAAPLASPVPASVTTAPLPLPLHRVHVAIRGCVPP